jgi:hypothetical protein
MAEDRIILNLQKKYQDIGRIRTALRQDEVGAGIEDIPSFVQTREKEF